MSALAEALLAAQRGTLAAMQRAYLAGALEDDDGVIEVMNRIGCTDTVEQTQYLAALETMRGLGVQTPTSNGTPKEAKPASEAQWKLIRRLADERGQVAPEGPLTLEQASQVIEDLDEHREEREELAALDRDDGRAELVAERAYWQDVGLEPAERVTLETARWSR